MKVMPPRGQGVEPNRGNTCISIIAYSSRMAEQNVTKFGMKHHLEKGNEIV